MLTRRSPENPLPLRTRQEPEQREKKKPPRAGRAAQTSDCHRQTSRYVAAAEQRVKAYSFLVDPQGF